MITKARGRNIFGYKNSTNVVNKYRVIGNTRKFKPRHLKIFCLYERKSYLSYRGIIAGHFTQPLAGRIWPAARHLNTPRPRDSIMFMLRICSCSGRWQQLRLPDEEKRRRSRRLRISVQLDSVQNVDRIRVLSVADPGGSRPAGQPDPPELRLDQISVSRRRRRRRQRGGTVVRDGVRTGGGDEAEGGLLRGGVHPGAALRPSDRRVADHSTVRRL